MSAIPSELLEQLCALVRELRTGSADFLEHHEDGQHWYNRGYANGMLRALRDLLGEDCPCGEALDDEAELQPHRVMAWGKAYGHGEAMGERETHEITGNT
ncbi:hypothetical protein [endosymbiont of unidentified scaly snail isolate Monju]|uniref:hypothetical protein n=1 Tax=endosymbiont of unidentified scaly snail isolate Monju TaxID=1248727 RepID=UPI0005B7E3EC|nr:hypothetical protein [endosymbiont of unidentified scaly snail isolate Monju]